MLTQSTPYIIVIIPAYNEENSIGNVLKEIPDLVREVVVVNNNSSDHTAAKALAEGAKVVDEPASGYGNACLRGLSYVATLNPLPDIIVFLDGDYSDYPEELLKLIAPIQNDNVDMVIGARVGRHREKGAMTPQQIFGNWLATKLMKLIFGATFTDLGPFRAIRYDKLLQLQMQDKTYGWTVEMQLKAHRQGLRYVEVPVHYRKRIGYSKVSGTIKGAVMAGIKIIGWIVKFSLK